MFLFIFHFLIFLRNREIAGEQSIDASATLSMASTELSRMSNPALAERIDFLKILR